MFPNPAGGFCADRAHGTVGAARRRRNRRMRAFLKHERMTVAMNLATFQHHSYMKSALVNVGVQVGSPLAPVIEYMSSAPVIWYWHQHLQCLILRPVWWTRSFLSLTESSGTPWSRGLSTRLYVQILDALVPLKMEQLVDFFKDLDIEVPAQVIEVPKISQDIIPQRSVDLVPQMVEQLMEVPTIVSYSSLHRSVEHRVDIPVPGRGWRSFGLQGFLPGQSSTTPQFSKKRISERTVEQIVRFPGEGLQDFRPGQSSPASSSFHSPASSDDDANEPGDGVFRTLPHGKKVRSARQVSADLPRHVSSWTPAAYEQSRGFHEQASKEEEKEAAEYEEKMQELNQRVQVDLPLSAAERLAWRQWIVDYAASSSPLLGRGGRGRRGA